MNDLQPSPDWVEQAVQAHLTTKNRHASAEPSPELRRRCRAAALSALDILQMQDVRPQVETTQGPLIEHFQVLARRAGVKLQNAFKTLSIKCCDVPDLASARGLARLTQCIGMGRAEALLRLRIGFALISREAQRKELEMVLRPVRARGSESANMRSLESVLRSCEASYSPQHRAQVNQIMRAFSNAFDTLAD